jgi:N-acetylglucosaminyl-diphospho-decaprenol L-rhamnosyltransferase
LSGVRDTSVIIVNHDGSRWLHGCLGALAHDRDELDVVLVDNASSDESRQIVSGDFPWVRLVALDRNEGFAGGNNAGVGHATGRFLAFLNNDTHPRRGWWRALRRALMDSPDTGLATACIVYMHDPATVDSAGDGLTRWGGPFKRGHGQPAAHFLSPANVFGACGAAFMIRRELYEQIGGFDAEFFMTCEDVDLSYRARLRGHRCAYVPEAVVEHAVSASLGRLSASAVFYGQRNVEWMYLKNSPAGVLWRSLPGHLIYMTAAAAYFARVGHLGTFVRAKTAALAGLGDVWRKRRHIQRTRTASTAEIWAALEPRWLGLKWREKRFDLSMPRTAR